MRSLPALRARAAAACVGALGVLTACPGPARPVAPPVAAETLEIGRAGEALRGVAASADGAVTFALFARSGAAGSGSGSASGSAGDDVAAATGARAVVEARRGATVAWHAELAGAGGPIAASGGLVCAASRVRGTGDGGVAIHGEPGAIVTALDAATGAVRWRARLDGNEWIVVTALAAAPDGGCIVGGTFSGTARFDGDVGAAATGSAAREPTIVSAASRSDGFVARLAPSGDVAWVTRFGGLGADAVAGVAAAGNRVALVGTFASTAVLGGVELPAFDPKSPLADIVVAELDLATGARAWAQTFGGAADDEAAGVAIDASGRVWVAATARETVRVADQDFVARGPADGLVVELSGSGAPQGAALLGGADFDGLRGVVAAGDRAVVAGFYSGAIQVGAQRLVAGGGDDAFVAELDPAGGIARVWPITGPGREDVIALAPLPGGFAVAVSHTAAATIDGVAVPAPADPLAGAAIAVRAAP
jgi:outer membrane protein assembly factor BamB|nr:hypothetical protein [Kofleriaceae bacterium]